MRKIASVFVAMFSIIVLSANCFAQEEKASSKLTQKIAKQMIKENELPKICVDESKGNVNRMITITRKDFGPSIDAFVVTGVEICCMSPRRCAKWVYKKNSNGTFSKVYGIDSPDDIIPIPTESHNGMYDIETMNSFEQKNTFYEFDGKQYKFIKEDYYGK